MHVRQNKYRFQVWCWRRMTKEGMDERFSQRGHSCTRLNRSVSGLTRKEKTYKSPTWILSSLVLYMTPSVLMRKSMNSTGCLILA